MNFLDERLMYKIIRLFDYVQFLIFEKKSLGFHWKRYVFLGFLLLSFSLMSEDDVSDKSPILSEKVKKYSRREGYLIAEDIKTRIEWIDLDSVLEGMQEYIQGVRRKGESDTDEDLDFYKIAFQLFEFDAKNNLHKAEAYLKELSADKKIQSLENGKVLYEVITDGHADHIVEKGSSPTLHYSISTLSGQEIVNTRNLVSGPFQVPLLETIPGFLKGVEGMRVGERRKIYIHPDMGYEKAGHLPPNSLLIVDVEIMKA